MSARFTASLLACAIITPLLMAQDRLPANVRLGFQPAPDAAPTKPKDPVLPKPVLGPPQDFGSAEPFRGRLSARTDVGDGVGYTRGYTNLEGLLPIWQTDTSMFFTDLRIVNFLHQDRWEYNAGLGYRWLSPLTNCVLGINAFYDGRRTDFHYWQQIGIGVEALSPCIEFRANGYFIIGPQSRQNGDAIVISRSTVNNNIVTQRLQLVEHALSGLDTEIGGRLPFLDRFIPRAYLGYYTYSSEAIASTHGIRGRLEAQVTERAALHFAIQHDRLFQTTVSGGVTISLGAPAYRTGNSGSASWSDVLHQRLQRDVNIVIAPETQTPNQSQALPPQKKPPIEKEG